MNYFEVLYSDAFNRKHVALLSTKEETPYQTNCAYATGYNGCKIIEYKRTDFEHFRGNKIQFYTNYKTSV